MLLLRATHFQVLSQLGPSSQTARCLSFSEKESVSDFTAIQPVHMVRKQAAMRQSITSTDPSTLVHEIRKLEQRQRQLGEEANRALEVLHNEVASQRLGSKETAETIVRLLSEIKDIQAVSSLPEDIVIGDAANLKEEITRLNSQGNAIASLEKKLENAQKSIDILVASIKNDVDISEFKSPEFKTEIKKKKTRPFSLSNNTNMQTIIRSPCSPKVSECDENRVPNIPQSSMSTPPKSHDNTSRYSSREGTPTSARKANSVDVKKMHGMFKNAAEDNIRSIRAYVTELKERVAKLQYQKHLLVCQVIFSAHVCLFLFSLSFYWK